MGTIFRLHPGLKANNHASVVYTCSRHSVSSVQEDSMILVSIHPFDSASSAYGPAAETRQANDLGEVMKLFPDSGDSGMAFQYVVSDKESGEPLVTYYAEQNDLAGKLPVA